MFNRSFSMNHLIPLKDDEKCLFILVVLLCLWMIKRRKSTQLTERIETTIELFMFKRNRKLKKIKVKEFLKDFFQKNENKNFPNFFCQSEIFQGMRKVDQGVWKGSNSSKRNHAWHETKFRKKIFSFFTPSEN